MIPVGEDIGKLPIFFILARGRSGSTLLRTMLDANPAIAIPEESRFVQYLYYKFGNIRKFDRKTIIKFYNDIITCYETPDFEKELLKHELLKHENTGCFSNLCKTAYLCINSVFNKSEIKIIGDKNPRYSFFAPTLFKIFPDARFIHLTRDYRDSTLSFYKVKGMGFEKKNAAFLTLKWKYYNKQILKFKSKNPELFFTVKYEDLVTNPEGQLKEVCNFLKIDFHKDMLEYHSVINKDKKILSGDKLETLHPGLLQPINKDKIGIWRSEMSESEIKISDFFAGKYAELLGYERKFKSFRMNYVLSNLTSVLTGWLSVYSKILFYKSSSIMRLFYKLKK